MPEKSIQFKINPIHVWFILITLSLSSWLLANELSEPRSTSSTLAASSLLIIAFIKARIVILYFMEVKNAPQWLRLLLEAWIVSVCAVLVGMLWVLP